MILFTLIFCAGNTVCSILTYTTGIPQHIYSLLSVQDNLLYSDWSSRSVMGISMETGDQFTLMEDLMRPAQFFVKYEKTLGKLINYKP